MISLPWKCCRSLLECLVLLCKLYVQNYLSVAFGKPVVTCGCAEPHWEWEVSPLLKQVLLLSLEDRALSGFWFFWVFFFLLLYSFHILCNPVLLLVDYLKLTVLQHWIWNASCLLLWDEAKRRNISVIVIVSCCFLLHFCMLSVIEVLRKTFYFLLLAFNGNKYTFLSK